MSSRNLSLLGIVPQHQEVKEKLLRELARIVDDNAALDKKYKAYLQDRERMIYTDEAARRLLVERKLSIEGVLALGRKYSIMALEGRTLHEKIADINMRLHAADEILVTEDGKAASWYDCIETRDAYRLRTAGKSVVEIYEDILDLRNGLVDGLHSDFDRALRSCQDPDDSSVRIQVKPSKDNRHLDINLAFENGNSKSTLIAVSLSLAGVISKAMRVEFGKELDEVAPKILKDGAFIEETQCATVYSPSSVQTGDSIIPRKNEEDMSWYSRLITYISGVLEDPKTIGQCYFGINDEGEREYSFFAIAAGKDGGLKYVVGDVDYYQNTFPTFRKFDNWKQLIIESSREAREYKFGGLQNFQMNDYVNGRMVPKVDYMYSLSPTGGVKFMNR